VSIKITAQFFPSWKYLSLEWDINPHTKHKMCFYFTNAERNLPVNVFPPYIYYASKVGRIVMYLFSTVP
jgi:hypothetical protein